MIKLERLDKAGNVMFTKEYPRIMATKLLTVHGKYPQSDLVMWREAVEAPKRGRKSKTDEDSE